MVMEKFESPEQPGKSGSQPATLERWSRWKSANSVQFDELHELDTVSIETRNHTYEITILNPATAEVLVRGGGFFPQRTVASVSGISTDNTDVKLHGIRVSFKLEILTSTKRIVTSAIRRIAVCVTP
jgi:hypothetical protein